MAVMLDHAAAMDVQIRRVRRRELGRLGLEVRVDVHAGGVEPHEEGLARLGRLGDEALGRRHQLRQRLLRRPAGHR